jgi:hypothetical protein
MTTLSFFNNLGKQVGAKRKACRLRKPAPKTSTLYLFIYCFLCKDSRVFSQTTDRLQKLAGRDVIS